MLISVRVLMVLEARLFTSSLKRGSGQAVEHRYHDPLCWYDVFTSHYSTDIPDSLCIFFTSHYSTDIPDPLCVSGFLVMAIGHSHVTYAWQWATHRGGVMAVAHQLSWASNQQHTLTLRIFFYKPRIKKTRGFFKSTVEYSNLHQSKTCIFIDMKGRLVIKRKVYSQSVKKTWAPLYLAEWGSLKSPIRVWTDWGETAHTVSVCVCVCVCVCVLKSMSVWADVFECVYVCVCSCQGICD